MSSEVAIHARGLTKAYHVYSQPHLRLWQMFWRGRRKFYKDFMAVQNIDLDIHHGETVGIIGRNGSGKSTLLQMICGTLDPTAGELQVNGNIAPLLSLGAGFNPEFTGRENACLNASILGLSDEEIEQSIASVASFADIGDFFDQPVRSYSSGMYSRLAFAVAINIDPDLLIIDEILAVGDEAFNRKCFAKIEEIKDRGATILFVSHSTSIITQLCDRALLLEGGELLRTGEPKEIVSCYKRLINAPRKELASVVREIREQVNAVDSSDEVEQESIGEQQSSDPVSDESGYLDPNLLPSSTVEFVRQGAEILNPRILDESGNVVNVLISGDVYSCAYEVRFSEPARNVRFGMMLKMRTGFEVGGMVSHRSGEGLSSIEPGSLVEVRLHFRATVSPMTYFMNTGVLGLRGDGEDGEEYLCRVLDALMFRVESSANDQATGMVDFTPTGKGRVEVALNLLEGKSEDPVLKASH